MMSNSDKTRQPIRTIQLTLVGVWWQYAATLKILLSIAGHVTHDNQHNDGWIVVADDWLPDRAVFTGDDSQTSITIEIFTSDSDVRWQRLAGILEEVSKYAQKMQHATVNYRYEEILNSFYEAQAHGEKPKL